MAVRAGIARHWATPEFGDALQAGNDPIAGEVLEHFFYGFRSSDWQPCMVY